MAADVITNGVNPNSSVRQHATRVLPPSQKWISPEPPEYRAIRPYKESASKRMEAYVGIPVTFSVRRHTP